MACFDEILALLEEIRDHEWCCDGIASVPGTDDIGGVDDSTLPPDIDRDEDVLPDGWVGGEATFDPYLCGQAQRVGNTTDEAVDAVFKAILAASNFLVWATLVVLAFGNIFGMAIAAILAGGYTLVTWSEIVGYYSFFTELREALGLEDPSGIVPQTKTEMSGIAQDIENAIYCANSASEAQTAIAGLIDGAVTDSRYAALLKLTYAISLRPIFWGLGGAPDGTGCVCEGTPLGTWDWGSDEDGLAGWSLNTAATLGAIWVLRYSLSGEGGEIVARVFTLDPAVSTVTLTVLGSRSGSAGTMGLTLQARNEGTLENLDSEEVQVSGTGTDPANGSEHEVTLDVSGRATANIEILLRKTSGSTGYPLILYEGMGVAN